MRRKRGTKKNVDAPIDDTVAHFVRGIYAGDEKGRGGAPAFFMGQVMKNQQKKEEKSTAEQPSHWSTQAVQIARLSSYFVTTGRVITCHTLLQGFGLGSTSTSTQQSNEEGGKISWKLG